MKRRLILFLAAMGFAALSLADKTDSPSQSLQKASTKNSANSYLLEAPLCPPDTSSPRATLDSFLNYMSHSHRLLMEAHQENQSAPGLFTKKDSKYKTQRAEILFKRAVYCLNLSEISTALKTDVGYEGALALKEILDRVEIPSAKSIPDLDDVRKDQMEHSSNEDCYRAG